MKLAAPSFLAALCAAGLTLTQTVHGQEVRKAEPATPFAATLPGEQTEIDAAAQLIAGLPASGPGPFADLSATPEWQSYAKAMDADWRQFDEYRLQPIREWRPTALGDFHPATLFYPFSGPDYIYARTLFPDATTYIFCGLEPTGTIPSLKTVQPLASTLNWTKVSTKTLLVAGYFVTKEMRVQLKQSPLQGTVPIICLMMARNGDRILSVKSDATHAEIRFLARGETRERTLHYFSVNLANESLQKNKAFLQFVAAARPDAGYLKSASYLMHEEEFSLIRETMLAHCPAILQDDSGIPFRAFDSTQWRFVNFGVYAAPLNIFKKYTQKDLADYYAKHPGGELTFGVGYHWDPKTANLMLIRRVR